MLIKLDVFIARLEEVRTEAQKAGCSAKDVRVEVYGGIGWGEFITPVKGIEFFKDADEEPTVQIQIP